MIQLYNGDCLEIMKDIPSKSIDLILCDPPYGTTPLEWDKTLPMDKVWEQYNRIIKDNGCICLFGQEPFSSLLRLSNLKDYKYDWYWQKHKLTNIFQCERRPGKGVECISVFYKNQPKYNPQRTPRTGKDASCKTHGRVSTVVGGSDNKIKPVPYIDDGFRYPVQVLQFNRDSNLETKHPTQKPIALLKYLVKTYTDKGDTVLDNCMGSGSCGVACKELFRNFIGIEQDPKYYEIAKNWINMTSAKRDLI